MIRSAVLLSALIGGCSPAPRGWLVDVHGFVLDAAGDGVSGASIELSNLDTETSIGTVYSDDSGRWSLPLFVSESESELSWALHVEAELSGYLPSELYWEVSWRDRTWPASPHSLGPGQRVDLGALRTPGMVLFEDTGPASSEAVVQDTTDGRELAGISVELRAGWNAPESAPVVAQASSKADGRLSFNLPAPGIYTASTEASGEYEASLAPLWVGPNAPGDQRILVSPQLVGESLRASLIWRDRARDLDLHMSGPLASEAGRYQVYVSDTPHPIYGEPVAEMEWFSLNWETGSVYTLRQGNYRFSAHDRDFGSETGNTALSAEEPTLLLWTSSGVFMESLGSGANGTIWQGLEYDPDKEVVYRLQGMSEGLNEWDVSAF